MAASPFIQKKGEVRKNIPEISRKASIDETSFLSKKRRVNLHVLPFIEDKSLLRRRRALRPFERSSKRQINTKRISFAKTRAPTFSTPQHGEHSANRATGRIRKLPYRSKRSRTSTGTSPRRSQKLPLCLKPKQGPEKTL